MKKSILTLTMIMTISLFAEDFKDEHLKCTLVSKDASSVSQREAEGLNEYKIDILITKTTLKANNEIFKYKETNNMDDIYSNYKEDYFKVYISDYVHSVYKKLNRENYERRYDCEKATFIEKTKYKYDHF